MTLHDATRRWLVAGLVAGLVLAASVTGVSAQSPGADPTPNVATDQATALAKQQQNPIASLISVPMQGNWDFGVGDREATRTLFNVQPVMPFGISRSANLILRVILPLVSQPGSGDVRANGIGDVQIMAYFSPAKPGRLIWGVGPAFLLPTATSNALGSEKFGIGPSMVVLVQPGRWTIGTLFNHTWSTSGANDREDVNTTFLQPFVNYNLHGGVALGAVMEATANWNADEHWTAPLLFTISKVARIGTRPMNFVFGAGPTVASPEGGPTWRFRFMAVLLFPR